MMPNKICHRHFAHPFFFLISSVLLVSVSFTTTAATITCTDEERDALLHFKSYIHHDPSDFLLTWNAKEEATNDCCYWSGITCNNRSRVTVLDLRFKDLEGKISPSLLNLSYLNYLELSSNFFHGTVPELIGSMTRLIYLDLGYNSFTGTIPMSIGSMTQLEFLDLSSNNFTGTIPLEFGNLTNLQQLSLSSLRSCTIETLDWLSHMSQLEALDMSGTSLSKADNWVNAISSLQKLEHLNLGGCNLSQVKTPYSFSSVNSSLRSIRRLYLGDNNLNSSMYHWLFPLTSHRLEQLDLSQNKLDGIPKYLGNLCGLTSLYFVENSIPVNFPDFLNNLSGCTSLALQELSGSSSRFTGLLSDDIQNFSSLLYLSLENNQIIGTISEKVWQLPRLERLDISSNYLTGPISENIGKSNIAIVNLSNNSLEGVRTEAHMSNLSGVEHIDLRSCKLGPRFPKWILTLKNLTYIDISDTKISDTIPEEFWNAWPSQLEYLNLSFNNINGKLTDLLSNFNAGALTIDLSSNNFYGPMPNVPSTLSTLFLPKNNLHGEISFLCQIADGYVEFLDLSYNSFTGQIPDCLRNFTLLKVLSLGNNNLSGRLPASIEYLVELEVLYLYNNSFSGELPSSLKNFSKLNSLDLGANMFSGYVPVWIGESLSRLYALSLTSNNFFGTIPSQLCQLVYLQILDLSINNLYGAIPSCLNNLTSMVQSGFSYYDNVHYLPSDVKNPIKYVDHAMVRWQGSVREFSSTLGFVKIINLSANNLTGKVPVELTDLLKLIALNFSMNDLTGEIPQKIGQMKELLILDLSRNNLSGRIPSSMSNMTLLNYLNVSYNNLSGRIPSGTQLQSFEPSSYTGNVELCGLPVSIYCPGDKELDVPPITSESENDGEGIDDLQRWFYIGGATGFGTGFWMVCTALLVSRRGRHAFFQFMQRT